jgi:sulfur relay (sulfurtransferase) DsrC/TusE family protein
MRKPAAWEEAWQPELNQQLAEIDQGITLGEPHQQVIQDLKEKYQRKPNL